MKRMNYDNNSTANSSSEWILYPTTSGTIVGTFSYGTTIPWNGTTIDYVRDYTPFMLECTKCKWSTVKDSGIIISNEPCPMCGAPIEIHRMWHNENDIEYFEDDKNHLGLSLPDYYPTYRSTTYDSPYLYAYATHNDSRTYSTTESLQQKSIIGRIKDFIWG